VKDYVDAVKKAPSGQMGLFSAPFENLPLRDAIDFYKHEYGATIWVRGARQTR
jgi:hypothetical protein